MEQEYQQMVSKGLHSHPIHLHCRKEIELQHTQEQCFETFLLLDTHVFHILLAQIVAKRHGHITI